MNEEKTIHKFLNKEKDKKIYDVWVDRYTCNRCFFLNSGTMEKANRKYPRLNYVQWRERNLSMSSILMQHL